MEPSKPTKRKKVVGEPLPRPGLLRHGDVVAIPLGNRTFAYMRHYEDVWLGILDIAPTLCLLNLEDVKAEVDSVAFFVEYCEPIDKPDWIYLGKCVSPGPDDAKPPKTYVEDVLTPGRFSILDGVGMYSATAGEIVGLQKHVMLSSGHVREKVEEYFFPNVPISRSADEANPCRNAETAESVDWSDSKTFAPFNLDDFREEESGSIRMSFGDWDWLNERLGGDTIEEYYLNGYGIQGLVKAARFDAGFRSANGTIEYDSEGDVCCIWFTDFEDACATAKLAQAMLLDKQRLRELIAVARKEGFEE